MRVGASNSEYNKHKEGLPQGSMLCVTCFALAINDIVKQLDAGVHYTLYVGDFAIFVLARNETHASRVIRSSVNKLTEWTKTEGMRLSREKKKQW